MTNPIGKNSRFEVKGDSVANVEIKAVRKAYGSTAVIHGVTIDICDGEFVTLVGPSGCGKSTLLRMIAGLEDISGGEIQIGGRVVNGAPPKERDIAMVFQNYALYPHMTVAENMGFSLKLKKAPRQEREAGVKRAAEILSLTTLLDRYPRELSGGQRQRVAMGRAIVRNPQVFLFDEPLSNLDAKLRVQMRTEIKELHQRLKTTIIYVTHDQVEAMTMADRMVVLRAGRVQQFDTPDTVYRHPANQFVAGFIGSPTMNFFTVNVTADGLRLANGELLQLPAERLARLHAGQHTQAVLGIRAEQWQINPDRNAADASLRVRVSVVEPLGSDTLAYFDYDGQRHVVRLPPEYAVAVGEPLMLGTADNRLHLFDAANGAVLP